MSEYLNIRWLGSEESTADKFVQGPRTSVWHVSGDAMEEEGVMLLPKPTRFYDTPIATVWQQGAYGRVFQGFSIDSRDSQLGWQIYAGEDGDVSDWSYTDMLFRLSWAYDRLGRLEFETDESLRYLDLSLLSEPESYEGEVENGHDPHLTHDATVITKVGGPNPNFKSPDVVVEKPADGYGVLTFDIVNDGDMEMWPRWTVSSVGANTRWYLPDKSYGSEEYGRGVTDANRVWKGPLLQAGEHTVFDSDPRVEFADSDLATNVWARCKGQLMYPIPPHTKTQVQVSYENCRPGDVCRLTYHKEYTRPFGLSYAREV